MFRGYRGIGAALAGLGALITAAGFGAYWGSLYSPDHKQYQTVGHSQSASGAYHGVAEGPPELAGLPGPIERAIANPAPQSGQDHEKRDLAAQEAMSVWTFWMLVVSGLMAAITTLGTVLIWKQVSLTRQAVEDTGNATKAMQDANEIARAAQRPWVAIDCHLVKFERKSHLMTAEFIVEFKNIGKNIAYDCYHCAHVNIVNPDNREPITRIMHRFYKARSDRIKPNDPFIPGDTSEIRIRSNFAFFRNNNVTDQLSPVSATVTAAAYYKSSPGGEWHETEISFLIFGPDEFDMVIHPTIAEGVLGGKAIHLRRYVSGAIS
ncbi:hypothetical protein OVY48_21960 [Sphingobium sp. SA2]|uniref:hypothetical protein n=1 Tax=Sphingobium sp. SA2 TaxID=1524832 RepID=UPI0028C03987|nr:hypothetical protein [Sphingobium sp. SA2]MDT7536067.1 hypothetical protein [Sphingobium sp. SA2]